LFPFCDKICENLPRLPRNPIAKTDFIGFGGKGFWGFLNPFLQKGV
jgi:hypothetical protein